MSTEANKALVRRLFDEVFNKRNLGVLDEFIAPTYTNHSSSIPISGLAGVKDTIAAEVRAFPDLSTTIEDVIAEGDKVVVRCMDHFTRPSDGAKITLPWIEILRLEDGKAVEAWFAADTAPILADLNNALGRK